MRPNKGSRGYDGYFDPDNSDYVNFMADYGDALKNRNKSGYATPSSVSPSNNSKIGGNGKYYRIFTTQRIEKFWVISTASTVGIIAILIAIASIFLK